MVLTKYNRIGVIKMSKHTDIQLIQVLIPNKSYLF